MKQFLKLKCRIKFQIFMISIIIIIIPFLITNAHALAQETTTSPVSTSSSSTTTSQDENKNIASSTNATTLKEKNNPSSSSSPPPLYKLNITSSDGLIGQIQINMTNGTEPVDVVHQFCLSHDLPLSKRREILTVVCSTIACHRLRPILYVKKIYTNPSSKNNNEQPELIGTVRIVEGQEPVDVITKFYKSHDMKLSMNDGQRQKDVESVCKEITCSRLHPIIYTKTIVWDGQVLDDITIMETQEPADAVHAFAEKFSLPLHVRHSMLNHACTKVQCSIRQPLKPGPMYSMEDAELQINAPLNESLVLGPTLIVKYSLIIYDKEKFEAQGHAIHSCFHVLNSMDEIVSRNYQPGVSCPNVYPPILYGIKDGEYTLEGWLTDTPDPTRMLTEKTRIKFRMMDLGSNNDDNDDNLYPKYRKSDYISNENEYKTGIKLANKIRSSAKKTTVHDVLASMLQAEWPNVADRMQLSEVHNKNIVRMIEKPDLNNDMENIIRGSMHSFHLPLLVMTPTNTVWYKIENIDVLDLYGLKSLNGKNWMTDGAVNGCQAIEKNWHAIYEKYCRTERNSPTSSAEHKPSSVILSMVRNEKVFNGMPRSAVIVGQSFDSYMSEMTVWDGNHRLVALFGKAYMKAKGLTCFNKKQKNNWVLKDSKLTLYIGLSKEFQLPKGQGSLFCRLKEQDETQQRVPLDVSEYTRKLIHVKIAKEQNGL